MTVNAASTAATDRGPTIADSIGPGLRAKEMPEAVRKTAEEFESFFLSQMLGHMFDGIEVDGYFGGGQGESVYRSMMVQEYGRILSRSGGVGIADTVGRELMRLQEGS